MPRTASELFASLGPGESVDLAGEYITSDDVHDIPEKVTVMNGNFRGHLRLFGAEALTLGSCDFEADTAEEVNSVCKMQGGHAWKLLGCSYRGGWVGSHVGINLNTDTTGVRAIPTDWVVEDCRFDPIGKQWGTFPQGHSIYCITSPRVEMNGLINRCWMKCGPVGAALKLGGTGHRPRREGARGVLVTDTTVQGTLCPDGRCLAVLSQGGRSENVCKRVTMLGDGGFPPWAQAMDGALLHMEDTICPDGFVSYATWYRWGVWARSQKFALCGRPRGGVRWSNPEGA